MRHLLKLVVKHSVFGKQLTLSPITYSMIKSVSVDFPVPSGDFL